MSRVDRLHAGRVVDVRDGRQVRPGDVELLDAPELLLLRGHRDLPLFLDRGDQQHVRAVAVHLEVVLDPLPQHARCERTEALPELDLEVHLRLHARAPRVAEDAAGAQGPGPELHPAVEPADDLLVGEVRRPRAGSARPAPGARRPRPALLR